MRTVLALLLVAACTRTQQPKPTLGPVIGQSTARGPADPSRPVARDRGVTEGGGHLSGPVGSAPGSVTPTVGEQPSTIDTSEPTTQQPATVYAPSIPTPITTIPRAPATTPAPTPAPAPTTPITPTTPTAPGTATPPPSPPGPTTTTPAPRP